MKQKKQQHLPLITAAHNMLLSEWLLVPKLFQLFVKAHLSKGFDGDYVVRSGVSLH